jgi:hypothetical protein
MNGASIQYFTVTNDLYEGVETDTTDTSGSQPTVVPISGTVSFTPVDANANIITQVVSSALHATILFGPIQGRFSVDTEGGTPDGVLRALNGTAGVDLVDNQYLGLTALYYQVSYSNVVFDGIGERLIKSFYFAAPGNGDSIDLNTVEQLAL